MRRLYGEWIDKSKLDSKSYICSYCGEYISSQEGYCTSGHASIASKIYICHNCNYPTIHDHNHNQFPNAPYGNVVGYIDNKDVEALYDEARSCLSCDANTASVLCSRKLLMNIAVSKGAKEGLNFTEYVEYLSDKGYVPPDGKEWVDHIRRKGNQATHEISIMKREDAEELIDFIEMLLKFIYEFPTIVKKKISK